MNIDELFKSAYALLDEGAALLCAHVHVANNDTIKRHIKAVDAWREQYRAAKEAPAPVSANGCACTLSGKCAWHRMCEVHEYVPPDESPAPEPSAPPAGVPTCKGGRGKCGTRVEDLGGPALWGFELEGLWFCSQECRTNHIKATNPPPSDPVTVATGGDECPGCDDHCEDDKCPAAHGHCVDAPVATGGVPAGYRLGDGDK